MDEFETLVRYQINLIGEYGITSILRKSHEFCLAVSRRKQNCFSGFIGTVSKFQHTYTAQ